LPRKGRETLQPPHRGSRVTGATEDGCCTSSGDDRGFARADRRCRGPIAPCLRWIQRPSGSGSLVPTELPPEIHTVSAISRPLRSMFLSCSKSSRHSPCEIRLSTFLFAECTEGVSVIVSHLPWFCFPGQGSPHLRGDDGHPWFLVNGQFRDAKARRELPRPGT